MLTHHGGAAAFGAHAAGLDLADQLVIGVDEGAEQAISTQLCQLEMEIPVQLRGGFRFFRRLVKQAIERINLLVAGCENDVLHGTALHDLAKFQQVAVGGMAQLFGKGAGEGIAHHRLDERAALGRTAQVAPRLQNGQRLAQNSPAYAQLIGQLGLRRQPCAHGKLAALHGLRKLLRNPVGQALILNGVEVHHEKYAS